MASKQAYYFSHDSNARNDEKILNIRMQYGPAGYGVYFMLLERLRDDAQYMSVKDYNMLAFDLRVDAQLVKSIVEDFGLFAFTDDGKCFYSESLKRRMTKMDEVSDARSKAGQLGAAQRWGTQNSDQEMANAINSDGKAMAIAIEKDSNKKKRNKRKINQTKLNQTKEKETKLNQSPSGADGLLPIEVGAVEPEVIPAVVSRFDEFWKSYPKKTGKKPCQTKWLRINPDTALFNKMMNALDQQKMSRQWQKNNGQFIPNPLTWLNQERWNDELGPSGGDSISQMASALAELERMEHD